MFHDLRAIDVYAAARRIDGAVRHTPLRRSAALSDIAGGDVYLKPEHEQITGSFKLRGAFNAIAVMDPVERARGVVASSAGNHGLGVAKAAQHFGIPATIFVPARAPDVKKRGIAALGATVDDSEPDYDAAMVTAKAFAADRGARYINPCLGDPLLAGQGTVGLEIITELPSTAMLILPVGGGGLLGGVASFVRRVAPEVRIVGAQSEHTAAMALSLGAARVVEIPSVPTLADGLAGQIDEEALDIGRHGLDDIAVLTEEEIADAIAWLARTENAIVEGSGAVGVGALLHGRIHAVRTPAVIVVSGGNIDPGVHARVMRETEARPLHREGPATRPNVETASTPGGG
jgi:threonine dehydratase